MENADWIVDAHYKSDDRFDRTIIRASEHADAYDAFRSALLRYPHMNFRLRQGHVVALNSALGHGQ